MYVETPGTLYLNPNGLNGNLEFYWRDSQNIGKSKRYNNFIYFPFLNHSIIPITWFPWIITRMTHKSSHLVSSSFLNNPHSDCSPSITPNCVNHHPQNCVSHPVWCSPENYWSFLIVVFHPWALLRRVSLLPHFLLLSTGCCCYLFVPFYAPAHQSSPFTFRGDIKRTYPNNCEWDGIPPRSRIRPCLGVITTRPSLLFIAITPALFVSTSIHPLVRPWARNFVSSSGFCSPLWCPASTTSTVES